MNETQNIKVAVIGASGYTGAELVRILVSHPHVTIKALAAERNAGQPMGTIYPHLAHLSLPDLVKSNEIDWDTIDLVFCCLPHATSQTVIKTLPSHLKIIDLSADFRLYNTDTYATWYGGMHHAPELQKEAIYGLSEIYSAEIKKARLVACPGCYPTSASLPLFPLLKEGIISTEDIIIDAKSGVSGAGRSEKLANLYCEANEGAKAYGVCNHRHIPEMEQTFSEATGEPTQVNFTPHLVPMSRGMLADCYVKLQDNQTLESARDVLSTYYSNSPFIHILPEGKSPSTRDVNGTNQCHIALFQGRSANRLVLVSVIDNLVKGASGQAVQNMNLMYNFDETAGLNFVPVFP